MGAKVHVGWGDTWGGEGKAPVPSLPATAITDLVPTISQLVPDDHVYSLDCIIGCWNETHQARFVPELQFHNKSRDSCSCDRPLLNKNMYDPCVAHTAEKYVS